MELPDLGMNVYFPTIEPLPATKLNFDDLDLNTQQQLCDITERDIFTFNKYVVFGFGILGLGHFRNEKRKCGFVFIPLRSSIEEREILWEKRHYLHESTEALAKVLLTAHSWDVVCLPDLHSLVLNWEPISPANALHLLLPRLGEFFISS